MSVLLHENLPARMAAFMAREGMPRPPAVLVVGVSGGLDSVVLARLLHAGGYRLHLAHVNYGLRGAASEGDEAFVRALAEALAVPVAVRRADLKQAAGADGLQAEARAVRYAFFAEVAEAAGADAVAVAHHRDDQAETVLVNLIRGAGPEGLAAMPPVRALTDAVRLIRPLLDERRATLDAYAQAHGWRWRDDATNATTDYLRNRIRHEVLPLLEADRSVTDGLARTAVLMRSYNEALLQPALADAFARAARADQQLAVGVLRALPPVLRGRVLLDALRRWMPEAPVAATAAESIEALLDAQPGRRCMFGDASVWRLRETLAFGVRGVPVPEAVPVQPGDAVPWGRGTLRLDLLDAPPADLARGAPHVQFLDADRLTLPLVLRPWQPGDRFRPLGMQHEKLVSDFLTDVKVPAHRRRTIGVLVSEGVIVSVPGLRVADGVRVRPETRRVARCVWTPERAGTGP